MIEAWGVERRRVPPMGEAGERGGENFSLALAQPSTWSVRRVSLRRVGSLNGGFDADADERERRLPIYLYRAPFVTGERGECKVA